MQKEFLRFVASANEFLRIIILYYMFKYTFGITTPLLESLFSEKSFYGLNFGKTSYNNFVLTRIGLLTLLGAPNEFLRLIIINHMFKYTFGIKTTLLESLRSEKSTIKARFR